MIDLFKLIRENCKSICEVGCGDYQNSLLSLIDNDSNFRFIGFEPNIFLYNDIIKGIRGKGLSSVYNCAIYNKNKLVNFYLASKSSFVEGIFSPLQAQVEGLAEKIYNKTIVNAVTFDIFDDGSIDFLSLDAEGCDFFALDYIRSRPKYIQISIIDLAGYINPYHQQIDNWMSNNSYKIIDLNFQTRKCLFKYE